MAMRNQLVRLCEMRFSYVEFDSSVMWNGVLSDLEYLVLIIKNDIVYVVCDEVWICGMRLLVRNAARRNTTEQ